MIYANSLDLSSTGKSKEMKGVKPNRKNSIFIGVLFLFFSQAALAHPCDRDTLILDGEVIEIEVNDRSDEKDSLESASRGDIKKKIPQNRSFQLGLNFSALYNLVEADAYRPGYSDLNEVMEIPTKNAGSWDAALSIQRSFIELQIGRRKTHFGIECSFGFQQLQWRHFTLDQRQLEQDSIIGFRKENSQLFLDYVTIIDGPIPVYELDTVDVAAADQFVKANYLSLRIAPFIQLEWNKSWSSQLQLGITYRQFLRLPQSAPAYWLGEGGSYQSLQPKDWAIKKYILTPYASFSLDRKHAGGWNSSLACMIIGPAAAVNDHPNLQWNMWQLGCQFRISKVFN
jgi:hypothetical protein